MDKLSFTIKINAPKEKIWNVLWEDETYRKWTSVFSEGSRAESTWEEGSEVRFLNKDNEGMFSIIEEKIPFKFISFKHLGMLDKNGNKDTSSEHVKTWTGSYENYTLIPLENNTVELLVEMEIAKDFKDFFNKTWPSALDIIKTLSENK